MKALDRVLVKHLLALRDARLPRCGFAEARSASDASGVTRRAHGVEHLLATELGGGGPGCGCLGRAGLRSLLRWRLARYRDTHGWPNAIVDRLEHRRIDRFR